MKTILKRGFVMGRYILTVGVLFVVCCLIIPRSAMSQGNQAQERQEEGERSRLGLRVGATLDPNQFHTGFHIKTVEIAPYLRGQPNFELGVGDDFVVVAINPEVTYTFENRRKSVHPYVGSGVGFAIYNRRSIEKTSYKLGINILAGLEIPVGNNRSFLIESKFGLGGIPEIKFMSGITF